MYRVAGVEVQPGNPDIDAVGESPEHFLQGWPRRDKHEQQVASGVVFYSLPPALGLHKANFVSLNRRWLIRDHFHLLSAAVEHDCCRAGKASHER